MAARNAKRNAEIIRLRRLGAAPAAIAAQLGLSRNLVLGVLYRAGLTDKAGERSSRAAYTPEFRRMVLDTYRADGWKAAVQKWPVASSTIFSWARGL